MSDFSIVTDRHTEGHAEVRAHMGVIEFRKYIECKFAAKSIIIKIIMSGAFVFIRFHFKLVIRCSSSQPGNLQYTEQSLPENRSTPLSSVQQVHHTEHLVIPAPVSSLELFDTQPKCGAVCISYHSLQSESSLRPQYTRFTSCR